MSFRPPLWSWIVTVSLLFALSGLGRWQVQRGFDKAALQAQFLEAGTHETVELDRNLPSQTHAVARGTYDTQRQLLLDNQSRHSQPGYEVLTPLRLSNGDVVIVNRGWLRASPDRRQLPPLPVAVGAREVHGIWRGLAQPGLRLKTSNCAASGWPRLVEYPTADDLKCVLNAPVLDGQLLLDPDQPDGLVREWNPAGEFPPMRHYAYAAQWFALALTLLVLFIKFNLKPSK